MMNLSEIWLAGLLREQQQCDRPKLPHKGRGLLESANDETEVLVTLTGSQDKKRSVSK